MKNYNDYNDIINLEHHVSALRSHMAQIDRAAQFSPFSALSGYEEAISETARMTDEKIILDDTRKAVLNEKLKLLLAHPDAVITFTYFKQDEKKQGGLYITEYGRIWKVNDQSRTILMQNKTCIPMDDIIEIEGELFDTVDCEAM